MKSHLLLNVALLAALVGLALYAYFRPAETDIPEVRITQLGRDQISRVRIERHNAADAEMEKRGTTWHMLRPYQTRVQQIQIDRLLDISTATASEEVPNENLSSYGLDPAVLTVTLNDQSLTFGSINEITNEQYLGTDDRVYLVKTYFGYSIPGNSLKLVSRRLLGDDEAPVAFDFGDWQVLKEDNGAWSVRGEAAPNGAEELSGDTLNLWVAEWQLANSLSAVPNDGPLQGERIVIRFANGRSATFQVQPPAPDVLFLRVGENMRYELGAEAGGRLLDPTRVASN